MTKASSKNKTKPLDNESVDDFISKIQVKHIKQDVSTVHEIISHLTKEQAVLWEGGIIGYGTYHYVYATGREGDWMRLGLAPRKNGLSVYLMCGCDELYKDILAKLGKHKAGKSCLNIARLQDIEIDILKNLIELSWRDMERKYPTKTGQKSQLVDPSNLPTSTSTSTSDKLHSKVRKLHQVEAAVPLRRSRRRKS